jgi:Domain of unknown function (DUF4386)
MEPSAQQHASHAPTPVNPGRDDGWSIRNASLTAGVAILLMSVLAGFSNFAAVQGLVTEGNAAQTAKDITGSNGLFRLAIVSLFLVVALDVVLAWALYRVFSPVSRSISMLAACFRLVYAGVFLVAISQLVGVLHLLSNNAYLFAFSTDQLYAQALTGIGTFKDIWAAGLVLFGLHLLLIGYLAYRSGYVPKFLGVLLAIAGLGYVADSFGAVLSPGSWTAVSSFTFIGGLLLALWLLIWGRRLTLTDSRHFTR